MSDGNDAVLKQFHENGGTVERFGRGLVVMHTLGAKSGERRVTPVMGIPDGDGWIVAATYAGQPVDPAWAHNLRRSSSSLGSDFAQSSSTPRRFAATVLCTDSVSEGW